MLITHFVFVQKIVFSEGIFTPPARFIPVHGVSLATIILWLSTVAGLHQSTKIVNLPCSTKSINIASHYLYEALEMGRI